MSESKVSCPHCSQSISLDSAWGGRVLDCPSCQKPFTVPSLAPPAPVFRLNPAAIPPPLLTPVDQISDFSRRRLPEVRPTRLSGLAIVSLILSLFGIFLVPAIAGVICGHVARKRIRHDASLSGGGLALAGLLIGYLMIALVTGFGLKFVMDVKQRVEQVIAQRSGQIPTNQPMRGLSGSSGAKIRSVVPAPADPVTGTVHGEPFNYVRCNLYQGTGALEIDGREFSREGTLITIFLKRNLAETVENRTWHITPTTPPADAPDVFVTRFHDGSSTQQRINGGYDMELTTGSVSGGAETRFGTRTRRVGGTIAGTITLKINGSTVVDIKGNFAGSFN